MNAYSIVCITAVPAGDSLDGMVVGLGDGTNKIFSLTTAIQVRDSKQDRFGGFYGFHIVSADDIDSIIADAREMMRAGTLGASYFAEYVKTRVRKAFRDGTIVPVPA